MARGSGKFKTKRGGGRSFSRNLVLDENGTAVSVDRRPRRDEDEDSDEDEEEEEEEEDEEEGGGSASEGPELTRVERRELKKKQAAASEKKTAGEGQEGDEEDDDLLANPNHVTRRLNISDLSAPREPTRREREQRERQEAKSRYWKLHAEGKTDQAIADKARLAKVRADREAAAAKRKAEAEEKAKALEAAKAAQTSSKR